MKVRGEELLANWFGWANRTLEATADPDTTPWAWKVFAFRGYLLLQRVDSRLLEPYLPPAIFYNLLVAAPAGPPLSGRSPAAPSAGGLASSHASAQCRSVSAPTGPSPEPSLPQSPGLMAVPATIGAGGEPPRASRGRSCEPPRDREAHASPKHRVPRAGRFSGRAEAGDRVARGSVASPAPQPAGPSQGDSCLQRSQIHAARRPLRRPADRHRSPHREGRGVELGVDVEHPPQLRQAKC